MIISTKIEFIGDPTCPFCYLGYKRFEQACKAFAPEVLDIQIQPFLINPDLPSNGLEFQQYLFARFGEQAKIAEALKPITVGCEQDNIPLALDKIKVMPSALNAQRLIHWASELGLGDQMFSSLTDAYFAKGLNIGEESVLRAHAVAADMDGETITHLLATDKGEAEIKETFGQFAKVGITEVPTWIIGGHYVVTGVQTAAFWQNVIGEIDEKGRELARKSIN